MTDFDSSYGYTLDRLLQVGAPAEPDGFVAFWQARHTCAIQHATHPELSNRREFHRYFDCFDLCYTSTGNFEIGGWLLIPKYTPVSRGLIVGHGYSGRDQPDSHLPVSGAALMFPCFRGLSRSRRPPVSDNPSYHVLHDIDNRERYILGGCVEDLWLAVSAMLALFPDLAGHIGYLGISFGGGIGALALPWEPRIQRAHFNVPSFGNHPLRLKLPTWGSAAAVQQYWQHHRHVLETLSYYDAAVAARHIHVPVHIAAALADPVVAPPGQFSIYNALPGTKKLFVLDMGHSDYPRQFEQSQALLSELKEFFGDL